MVVGRRFGGLWSDKYIVGRVLRLLVMMMMKMVSDVWDSFVGNGGICEVWWFAC